MSFQCLKLDRYSAKGLMWSKDRPIPIRTFNIHNFEWLGKKIDECDSNPDIVYIEKMFFFSNGGIFKTK